MRSFATCLLAMSFALSLVAAAPSEPSWTTVAEEPCVAGLDDDQLTSSDWEELCSVAWRTVAAGDGAPTTVEIQLTAVGSVEDRVGAVYYSSAWTAGDCAFTLEHRDETDLGPGLDVLRVRCGEITTECDLVQVGDDGYGNCRETGDLILDLPVSAPAFDDTTVTWRVTFDGELAQVEDLHSAGSTVAPTLSTAGDAPTVATGHIAPAGPNASVTVHSWARRVCVLGHCPAPADDGIAADRTYTIG